MLQMLRERLTLVLIGLLPFHAFLVTVLTKVIAGPGHRPLPALVVWKEALLGLMLLIALVEIALECKMQNAKCKMRIWSIDAIDATMIGSIVVAVLFSILNSQFSILKFALGAKYDFLPLVVFLILRRVEWSERWRAFAMNILVADGIILSLYGLATLLLPMEFFTALGYSDLHSLYLPDGPIAAFQQLGGSTIRRVQSAMSGPNQFGIWLLIPLGILLADVRWRTVPRSSFLVPRFILLAGLVATFSRAAWIAAISMAIVAWFLQSKPVFRLSGFLQGTGIILSTFFAIALLFPSAFLRLQSTSDHLRRPVEAMKIMIAHPLGLGLGSAGPASNRFNDTCVELPLGSNVSWAADRQDLCVFVGRVQKQPAGRNCNCPLLTENWYLQWGVEMGLVGLVLSVMLPFFVLRKCKMQNAKCKMTEGKFYILRSTFYIFLGISIAGLFLHSFEDSAVAYSIWLSLASVLPVLETPNASR